MTEISTGPDDGPIHPRVRVAVLSAFLVAGLFSAACFVYNAPPSPARNRMAPTANAVLQSYFWQDWQLFAPTPGDEISLISLRTRLRLPSGQLVETAGVEIEDAIDRLPRQFPLNPTKMPGILLALDESAENYDRQAAGIEHLPEPQRTSARNSLDRSFAVIFAEMGRFFSARATTLYPGKDIVAVQATFERQPIVPFSRRYADPQPVEPVKPFLQTSWLAYTPGVAQ